MVKSNWELSKKPVCMQADTWEIFFIRLHQSCVLLYEFCVVVLQVVWCNLKLVEILSKSTKAAKITLLYRINCSVLKGFPALEAKIPYLRASMHEGRDRVNCQLTYGQNFNWQLTNRWKSNWQLTFVVGFLHMSHIGYMILDTQLDRQRDGRHCWYFKSCCKQVSNWFGNGIERHRSHITSNDAKELSRKYGLWDFDVKLYHMAPKSGGKSDNFALTTDEQWNLELLTMLAGTGSELNSMYWNGLVFGIDINRSVKSLPCGIERL